MYKPSLNKSPLVARNCTSVHRRGISPTNNCPITWQIQEKSRVKFLTMIHMYSSMSPQLPWKSLTSKRFLQVFSVPIYPSPRSRAKDEELNDERSRAGRTVAVITRSPSKWCSSNSWPSWGVKPATTKTTWKLPFACEEKVIRCKSTTKPKLQTGSEWVSLEWGPFSHHVMTLVNNSHITLHILHLSTSHAQFSSHLISSFLSRIVLCDESVYW